MEPITRDQERRMHSILDEQINNLTSLRSKQLTSSQIHTQSDTTTAFQSPSHILKHQNPNQIYNIHSTNQNITSLNNKLMVIEHNDSPNLQNSTNTWQERG